MRLSPTVIGAAAGLVATLVSLASPSRAAAQPVTEASAHAQSEESLSRGLSLARSERWLEALPHFEASVRLEASPLGYYNLALTCSRAGRPACAVEAFERYLASPEAGASSARTSAIRTELGRLSRSVSRVQMEVRPPETTVRIDGHDRGRAATEVRLDPGTHALEFVAPGHETQRRQITLQAGATTVIEVVLPVTPTVETPAPPQRVEVAPTVPPASVVLGLTTPHTATPLPAPRRGGWLLPTVIGGSALVTAAAILGIAYAVRGVAEATPSGWDTVQE